MEQSSSIVVAVLAGGRGRRLGEPKMLAEIDGRPLLHITLRHAAETGLRAIVVTKRGTPLPPVTVPVIYEPAEPEHPLLGIVVAMRLRADATGLVVLGGDLPFVPPALIRALADAPGPLVPIAAGRPQPLVARYDRSQLPALEAALAEDASITATVRALGAETLEGTRLAALDPSGHAFVNVNTPEDLERARAIATQRLGANER